MSRPVHHANATRNLFQNPWQTPNEPDPNTRSPSPSGSLPGSQPATDSEDQSPAKKNNNGWLGNFSFAAGRLPSPSLSLSIPSLISNIPLEWAQDLSKHGVETTKVVKPDFSKFAGGEDAKVTTVKATWLGHASFLVELPLQKGAKKPVRVLFDPMFSERAGPSAWTGIRRRLPPPCTIAELPEFHFVCISHNHYDHFDLPSIQEIVRTRGDRVTFLVPLGMKSLLVSSGILSFRIHELDWWDEVSVPCPFSLSETIPTFPPVTFVCVPAQHNSGRNVVDKNRTLWCGWVVKQELGDSGVRVYHAGDTGYLGTNGPCPAFKGGVLHYQRWKDQQLKFMVAEIGERCGPIDLAMIPIWRGGMLSFISQLGFRLTHHPFLTAMHAHPSDAVAIHRDVRSRHSLAMHFATFVGSDAEVLESLVELNQAREKDGLGDWYEEGGIGAVDIGETVEVSVVEERRKNGQHSEHDLHSLVQDA